METFSLYRGDRLLGRFAGTTPMMHHDQVVGHRGVLELVDPATPLLAMMQAARSIGGVRQGLIPPIKGGAQSGSGGLEPLPQRGVAEHEVFRIGLPNGQLILPAYVNLEPFDVPTGVDAHARFAAEGVSTQPGPIWIVSFVDITEGDRS